MSLGTLFAIVALVLAILSLFVAGPLLPAAAIFLAVAVLVGASPIVR